MSSNENECKPLPTVPTRDARGATAKARHRRSLNKLTYPPRPPLPGPATPTPARTGPPGRAWQILFAVSSDAIIIK